MFFYKRRVRLEDTDAVKVLYFANQLKYSMEAFEEFLHSKGISLSTIIDESDYLLPIVHAEADYSVPLHVGDLLQVALWISHIGTSSVHFSSEISRDGVVVGRTKIIHVATSKVSEESIPLPKELLEVFRSLHERVKLNRNLELRQNVAESITNL